MQKTPKHPTAGKAAAGKTGKTGKTGKADTRKQLTPEQRERKNKHDRERRAELRRLAAENRQTDFGKGLRAKQAKCGHQCGRWCEGYIPTPLGPGADFFSKLREAIVGAQGAAVAGKPACVQAAPGTSGFAEVAPGVVRRTIELPGATVSLTVVDAEKVDPLSDYSPIPWPVRRELLLSRMAREISDIVDASIEALS